MTRIKTEDAELAKKILSLRADPRSYRWGIYSQVEDPCVVLPKRLGVGWTINFGHRFGLLFLVGFVLMAAAPPLTLIALGWALSPSRGWMVFPLAPLVSVGLVVGLAARLSNRPIGRSETSR